MSLAQLKKGFQMKMKGSESKKLLWFSSLFVFIAAAPVYAAVGTVNQPALNPASIVKVVDYCPEDKLKFLKNSLVNAVQTSDLVPVVLEASSTKKLKQEKTHTADFVFSDPYTAAGLIRYLGYRPLLSLVPAGSSINPDSAAATAVFVRRSSRDFYNLRSLIGANLMINSLNDFPVQTLLAADAELLGIDSRRLLENSVEYIEPLRKTIERFAGGSADALVLPACALEAFNPELQSRLRIIEPRMYDGLSCMHSTQTSPSWILLASTRAAKEQTNWITSSFLSQSEKGMLYKWRRYDDAHRLIGIMDSGDESFLAKFRKTSIKAFVQENLEIFMALALTVILLLIGLASMALRLARNRAEMLKTNEKLGNLERASIVGQMSSIVAHELKQPIFAIRNYASSLKRRKSNGRLSDESLDWAVERIVAESMRANEIVEHVRSYAKGGGSIVRSMGSLSRAVSQTCAETASRIKFCGSVATEIEPGIEHPFDLLEVALILRNLMTNAAQALEGIPNSRITISLKKTRTQSGDGLILLEVSDNGRRPTPELLEKLGQPTASSKPNGLGLGLSIVSRIVENWGGRLVFLPAVPSGLCVRIELLEQQSCSN